MTVRWLASYPRSGNTWARMLLATYLAGRLSHWSLMNAGVVAIGYFETIAGRRGVRVEDLLDEMLDARRKARGTENDEDPLILKTHAAFSEQIAFAGRADKAIYLLRNPGDVLISHLNYRRLTYQDDGDGFASDRDYALEYIRLGGDPAVVGRYGSWEENVRSWIAPPPGAAVAPPQTLVIRYEAILREPAAHLRQILEFLGYPVDEARVADAVTQSERNEMRKLEQQARDTNTFFRAREGHWFVGDGSVQHSLRSLGADVEGAFLSTFGPAMEEFGYGAASPILL